MTAYCGVLIGVESKIFLDFTLFRCYVNLGFYLATLGVSY